MHILLPPSESKRSGGGIVFAASTLAHAAHLRDVRRRVQDALIALSSDNESAVRALKLGVKNRDELLFNQALVDAEGAAVAMPAIERYVGVLYDALDATDLDSEARDWLDTHVSVQSALYGLVRANDAIPAYRLSASSALPELGSSLKKSWSAAHRDIDWQEYGWVLDLRSKDYAALAPLPAGAGVWLQVSQRTAEGEVRALNHFNKAAKGDLVRRLARSTARINTTNDFVQWAAQQQLEVLVKPETHEATLVTELGVLTG